MNSPNLDLLIERIQNPQTKEYFTEVLSTFYTGAYRSTIVMLHSIVICDIIFKLQELDNFYGDNTSHNILEEIQKKRQENPKSPEWEKNLIDKCVKENRVVELDLKTDIECLQRHRNLCAHPSIKDGGTLYTPNRQTAMAHMVNMLNGLLCKPAFLSRDLIIRIIEDISFNQYMDSEKLSKYLSSKYFDKINNLNIEYKLFKTIWKFTFKLRNDDCDRNRQANYRALIIILNRHKDYICSKIQNDSSDFTNLCNIEDPELLNFLTLFFNLYPSIFNTLEEHFKLGISEKIQCNTSLKAYAIFLSGNITEHLKMLELQDTVDTNILSYLLNFATNELKQEEVLNFTIQKYAESRRYDDADKIFDDVINQFIKCFNESQLFKILEVSDNNSQIYDRRRAAYATTIIVKRLRELGNQPDMKKYSHLKEIPEFLL